MTAELIEVIFYAVIAIAIFIRLHNILGKLGSGVSVSQSGLKSNAMGNVINARSEKYVDEDNSEQIALDIAKTISDDSVPGVDVNIKSLINNDPSFKLLDFISKVEIAYELIINAFTKGELDNVKSLVDSNIMKKFQDMVSERKIRNEIQETTIISINTCKILNVFFFSKSVYIQLLIKSDQLITIKDKNGDIKYGDVNKMQKIEDRFTFSRKINAPNSVWIVTSID